MKLFISWSGEQGKKIAEKLSLWIPSVLQSVEPFFSPSDIEKGENWDGRLTLELSQTDFGIVCLTQESVNAPWIHFEAGALSKTLNSRLWVLMFGINTSSIKGPLSRFQNTTFNMGDFFELLKTVNKYAETPLDSTRLKYIYSNMWPYLYNEIMDIMKEHVVKDVSDNSPIEEILRLVRKIYANSVIEHDESRAAIVLDNWDDESSHEVKAILLSKYPGCSEEKIEQVMRDIQESQYGRTLYHHMFFSDAAETVDELSMKGIRAHIKTEY